MIIWSGLGYIAAVLTFGACLAAQYFFDARFGDGYYSSHLWAVGLALVAGGLSSAAVGYFLKAKGGREVVHAQTGELTAVVASQHSFFFIPLHWAGLVICGIGVVLAISDAIR